MNERTVPEEPSQTAAAAQLVDPVLAPDALDGPDLAGRLVRGSALRFISYAATTVLSIGSAAALTHHLSPGRFSLYTTILSLVTVISTITDSGMSNIGIREYSTLVGDRRERLLQELLSLRVALSLVGVVVIVVWTSASGYPNAAVAGGLAAGLATIALVFQHTLTIPLSSDLRLGALSSLEFARQAVTVGGIIVLAELGAGIFPLLAITLLANVTLIVPTAAIVRRQISLRPAFRFHELPELLRATVTFSLATAVGTIYVYMAQILTSYLTSSYQSGLFSFSFRIFIVAASTPTLVISTALPVLSRAARDDSDRLRYVLQRISDAALVAGVGVAVSMSAGAAFIVSVIAGHHFAGATPVLGLQAWSMIPSFAIAGWSYGLLSLRMHRSLLVASVVALLVATALTAILASTDGARGAAIATIGGETSVWLCAMLALVIPHPEYRPRLTVIPKVVVCGASAAAVGFATPLPSLVRAIAALLVYAVGVQITGALPRELGELVPGFARIRWPGAR